MLTSIVLTKNEEENIEKCLQSILFSDEVLIIDDYSTDKTIERIKQIKNEKIKIFQRNLQNNFSTQRNFALEKAKGDWILFIDADEEVSDALAFEIMQATTRVKSGPAYSIRRRDILWGKELKHGEAGMLSLLRLGRKESGIWRGSVHEVWDIKGKTETFKNSIKHYPHQTLKEFIAEINFYTTLRSEELFEKKVKVGDFSIILYPSAKFVVNYFVKRGFLDGTRGFVFAMLMSFHSFLVRGKLWLLWQKNK